MPVKKDDELTCKEEVIYDSFVFSVSVLIVGFCFFYYILLYSDSVLSIYANSIFYKIFTSCVKRVCHFLGGLVDV